MEEVPTKNTVRYQCYTALAGQEGTVKELAVRLLSDALGAAENLES